MMFPKDQSATLKEGSSCPEETEQDQGGRELKQEEAWVTGAKVEQVWAQDQAVIVSARPAGRECRIDRGVPVPVSAVLNAVPQWLVRSV